MKRLIIFLTIGLCVAAAPKAFAWTAQTRMMILEDALRFAPTRLKSLVDTQSGNLPLLLALSHGEKRRDVNLLFDEAVRTLAVYKISNEKKVRVLLELSVHVLDVSSPSAQALSPKTIDNSTSCFQAEWDGQDYVSNMAKRLENTQKALEPFRERYDGYLKRTQDRLSASEAVGTCYHAAVNDLADVFYSVWRDATGDTAAWFTSKGDRIWHPPAGGILQLPKGFDPIPTLGEYYDEIDNQFVDARIRRGQGVPPPPSSFYLFELPITLVNSEGAAKIKDWKARHQPGEPAGIPAGDFAEESAVMKNEPDPLADLEAIEDTPEPKAPEPAKKGKAGDIKVRDLGEKENAAAASSGSGDAASSPAPVPAGDSSHAKSPRSDGEVAEVIRGTYPQVQAAYKNYLTRGDMGGKFVAEFTITPEGNVKDLNFPIDDIGDEKFKSDLTLIFNGLKFSPDSRGEVHVKHPLIFQKNGA